MSPNEWDAEEHRHCLGVFPSAHLYGTLNLPKGIFLLAAAALCKVIPSSAYIQMLCDHGSLSALCDPFITSFGTFDLLWDEIVPAQYTPLCSMLCTRGIDV